MKLLKKEFVLAMHPITPMMLCLSAMVLIPNYPYVVVFFYVSMALFFTCLLGRENNDIVYSLNLPVSKSDIVKARFSFAVIIEMMQLVITTPFLLISQKINPTGNQAGMDANISLIAVAFIVYGLFNLVFFSSYYSDVKKVGIAFVKSSVLLFVCTVIDIVSTYAIPFVRDRLDTIGNQFLTEKLVFLAIGIVVYCVLTFVTFRFSVKRFNKQDLN